MCCCDKPNVNGTFGYKWNEPNKPAMTHEVNPPDLKENEILLYDEPGRCGGIDSHCHHYRVIRWYSSIYLLVRNGAGDDRLQISLYNQQVDLLADLASNARYWFLNAIYHAYADGKREAQAETSHRWSKAAAEKRIKIRRRGGQITVHIAPSIITQDQISN